MGSYRRLRQSYTKSYYAKTHYAILYNITGGAICQASYCLPQSTDCRKLQIQLQIMLPNPPVFPQRQRNDAGQYRRQDEADEQ
jgi:hypothetical protein